MSDTTFQITPIELKKAVMKLPPAPEIFVKLSRLLKHRNTEMSEVIALVSMDPALVAKVCRLSSTAYFNTGEPIGSLDEAINRIGFKELFRIVGMASIGEMYGVWNLAYNASGDVIWHNSLAVGLAMEQLATANGEDTGEAYTLGILRSLGKLMINNCVKERFEPPIYELESDRPLLDWEAEVFDTTNPEAADLVLRSWNFPEPQLDALRSQYDPDNLSEGNRFGRMLNIACGIAEKVGHSVPGESSYWNRDDDVLVEASVARADVKSITGRVSASMKGIIESLKTQNAS